MTTLLVCTVGGPLLQLTHLADRLEGVDRSNRVWVTHDVPQSRSLLRDEQVVFVPYIHERRPHDGALQLARAAALIRDHDVSCAVSTGSAIAVPYLGAAAALGRRSIFIESAAFVSGRTRTARLLARLPRIETYVQYEALADRRWRCIGSVFDGFRANPRQAPDGPSRIVVTVGTSEEYGFRRLIERLRAIIPTDVEVIWQTGVTDVSGLDIEPRAWMPAAELEEAMAGADLVIAHAGAGSALAALEAGHRPVLVPRRRHRAEVKYDHQHQIAQRLESAGLARAIEADALTWDELVQASAWRAERETNPPILALEFL